MNPKIGKIILVIDRDTSHQVPAIITVVWSQLCINATVFCADGSTHSRRSLLFDESLPTWDSWRWPSIEE